jgi:hypothetical protein
VLCPLAFAASGRSSFIVASCISKVASMPALTNASLGLVSPEYLASNQTASLCDLSECQRDSPASLSCYNEAVAAGAVINKHCVDGRKAMVGKHALERSRRSFPVTGQQPVAVYERDTVQPEESQVLVAIDILNVGGQIARADHA